LFHTFQYVLYQILVLLFTVECLGLFSTKAYFKTHHRASGKYDEIGQSCLKMLIIQTFLTHLVKAKRV